jgi:hypothetical protein
MADNAEGQDWQAVIARSLAVLVLHSSGLQEKDLTTQGLLLERLGLSRREAAELLGTTAASLSELFRRRAKTQKGGSRGRAKNR